MQEIRAWNKARSCVFMAVLLSGGVFIGGCLPEVQHIEIMPMEKAQLQCERIDDVEIEEPMINELHISSEHISQALFPVIDSLCGRLDRRYKARITYESSMAEEKSTTKLTEKETKTATVRLVLMFLSERKNQTFRAFAQLESSSKKLLDIGESVIISDQDKAMLVRKAASSISHEAHNVFAHDVMLEESRNEPAHH